MIRRNYFIFVCLQWHKRTSKLPCKRKAPVCSPTLSCSDTTTFSVERQHPWRFEKRELHGRFGGDLDRLACSRVASHAGCTLGLTSLPRPGIVSSPAFCVCILVGLFPIPLNGPRASRSLFGCAPRAPQLRFLQNRSVEVGRPPSFVLRSLAAASAGPTYGFVGSTIWGMGHLQKRTSQAYLLLAVFSSKSSSALPLLVTLTRLATQGR